jgi:hypothetical protein
MPYERVATPIPSAQAFKQSSDAAIQSQATVLLALGAQLRGEGPAGRRLFALPSKRPQVETAYYTLDPWDLGAEQSLMEAGRRFS